MKKLSIYLYGLLRHFERSYTRAWTLPDIVPASLLPVDNPEVNLSSGFSGKARAGYAQFVARSMSTSEEAARTSGKACYTLSLYRVFDSS